MRVSLSASVLGALLLGAASAAPLDPADGALLSPTVSETLLHQCSRTSPQNFAGTWAPAAVQIRELEAALPAALQNELAKHDAAFARQATRPTVRQYAGFILGGRKIVYVNTLPRSMVDNPAVPAQYKPDWRHQPDVVCDGGPAFSGVEYDPQTKSFAHFAFNGPL